MKHRIHAFGISAVLIVLGGTGCKPTTSTLAGARSAPAAPHVTARRLPAHDVLCIVDGDSLRTVDAELDSETGDTLVAGVPLGTLYPAARSSYAATATWFAQNQPIIFRGRRYHGGNHPPQKIAPDLLENVGNHHGTPLFAERGDTVPEVIYVPLRPGCIFQSYIGIQLGPVEEDSSAVNTRED